jgi:hypothetical protein
MLRFATLVQIQSVMMRDIKSCGSQRPSPVTELGKLAIDPGIAEAATKLVEKVFDSCSQVNHRIMKVTWTTLAATNEATFSFPLTLAFSCFLRENYGVHKRIPILAGAKHSFSVQLFNETQG